MPVERPGPGLARRVRVTCPVQEQEKQLCTGSEYIFCSWSGGRGNAFARRTLREPGACQEGHSASHLPLPVLPGESSCHPHQGNVRVQDRASS